MTDPEDIPSKRGQIGWVLKNATVHEGELQPSFVFWIMERRGLVDYEDAESTIGLIKDVMKHSSEVEYDGS